MNCFNSTVLTIWKRCNSSPATRLLDIPIELFKEILEHSVLLVGLTDAIKLRLVCKLFNHEIPLAMHSIRILDIDHRRRICMYNNDWLLTSHILRQTTSYTPGTGNLSEAILLAARNLSVHHHETQDTRQSGLERSYIIKLSQAATATLGGYKGTRDLLRCLQHNTDEEKYYDHRKSTTNHIIAAAAYLGCISYFRHLIGTQESKYTIDSSENIYFGNPLRSAITQGHFELTRLLLDHGVNANQAGAGTGDGITALSAAASTGQQHFIDLILNPKYKCQTSGKDFEYSIIYAGENGHLDIVQYLIQRGEVNLTTEFWDRFLMAAIRHGQAQVVSFVVKSGIDLNNPLRGKGWQLPITEAARRGYVDVLRILLENGAVLAYGGRRDTMSQATRRAFGGAVRILLKSMTDEEVATVERMHETMRLDALRFLQKMIRLHQAQQSFPDRVKRLWKRSYAYLKNLIF